MRRGRWLRSALLLAVALAAALLLAGQLGAFAGRVPTDLGVRDARLKAPSATPNSVSSQVDLWPDHPMREYARIAALPLLPAGAPATMNRLRTLVEDMPGAVVVSANQDYLRVQFTTRWLGFVDDAEFWADPAAGVVQVRSASRLGRRDFGANRARIEALRARLAASG
ncbi:MAG: DUF1499 domain-containing protein [Burkholderiales bacterium]|nr:DUF1499 domain-containing protein [Burkholderiales bacterium]